MYQYLPERSRWLVGDDEVAGAIRPGCEAGVIPLIGGLGTGIVDSWEWSLSQSTFYTVAWVAIVVEEPIQVCYPLPTRKTCLATKMLISGIE